MPVKIAKNQPNIVEKLIKKTSKILKKYNSKNDEKSTQNRSKIHQKSILEASWGLLGGLERLGGLLGVSWGPLGGLLGPPGRLLRAKAGILTQTWAQKAAQDRPRAILGAQKHGPDPPRPAPKQENRHFTRVSCRSVFQPQERQKS